MSCFPFHFRRRRLVSRGPRGLSSRVGSRFLNFTIVRNRMRILVRHSSIKRTHSLRCNSSVMSRTESLRCDSGKESLRCDSINEGILKRDDASSGSPEYHSVTKEPRALIYFLSYAIRSPFLSSSYRRRRA